MSVFYNYVSYFPACCFCHELKFRLKYSQIGGSWCFDIVRQSKVDCSVVHLSLYGCIQYGRFLF